MTAVNTLAVPTGGRARKLLSQLLFALAVGVVGGITTVLTYASMAAATWTHPARIPPTKTPGDYGLKYEKLRLETEDGLALAAWYVPSKTGAAVIMIHGIGGNRGDALRFGRDLAEKGYGVLWFDLRGHGESDGETTSFGLYEIRDARAAVEFLKSRPDVVAERIGVYGISLGGSVAIMAAAEIPELRAVVADSTFASMEWLVRNQFSQLESIPDWLAPLELAVGGWQAKANPLDIAPVERIARIAPRPVLILHGDADTMFLVDNARMLYEAASDPKELWILPEVGHGGLYDHDPGAFLAKVGGWLDEALGVTSRLS